MYNFEDIFESYFGIKPTTDISYSPIKVENKDDSSLIFVDVPGYKRSDIKVEVDDKKLFIKLDGIRGKKTYKFNLNDADVDNIESKLEDGVLEIKVPSKKTNKKTITIN